MATSIETSRAAEFERRNPMTGKVVSSARAFTIAEARAAADCAARALATWSAFGPNARRTMLESAAQALSANGNALVAAMKEETGATEAW